MARLQPRPYQRAAFDRVRAANTIVCIPTGAGKTLIAAMAIDYFLETDAHRRVMFIVPTRVLVAQQAARCREQCARAPRVVELSGMEFDRWGAPQWRNCLAMNDVFVGTPEIFRRALVDMGALRVTDFSLIVFDECHHTTGNSPMASICRDALWPAARAGRATPRILGLTASFVNGSLAGLESKRANLEALMQARAVGAIAKRLGAPDRPEQHLPPSFPTLSQATLFCPDIPPGVAAGDASPGSSSDEGKFRQVAFEADLLPPGASEWVQGRIEELVGAFEGATGVPVVDVAKAARRTVVILEELGSEALCFAVRACIVPQLETAASNAAAVFGRAGVGTATRLGLERLASLLSAAADDLAADPHLCEIAPRVSGKARRLVELIAGLFREHAGDSGYRGIIFVDQIALTAPLARLLNTHLADMDGLNVLHVSGVGSMPDAQRERAMADFASGRSRLLVCTAALEEGVDVSDCSFVVRFSHFATTRSHIQGAGRARRAGAEVFYFVNDAQGERRRVGCHTQGCLAPWTVASLLQPRKKEPGAWPRSLVTVRSPSPSQSSSRDARRAISLRQECILFTHVEWGLWTAARR